MTHSDLYSHLKIENNSTEASVLRALARRLVKIGERTERGSLQVIYPSGKAQLIGSGEPRAEVTIKHWGAISALVSKGDVGWGEAYLEGLWDSPDIEALARFTIDNAAAFEAELSANPLKRLFLIVSDRIIRRNNRKGSVRNITAHYDVGDDFYRLWLDETMTYSSALFSNASDDLATAQKRKYQRLLDITATAGKKTLEIGCGWGGFAELAVEAGRDLTAITISPRQHHYATQRLKNEADIQLKDYRDIKGKFDSIVSIEMIEAVGEQYWPRYFKTIKDCLADHGKAAIQAIVVEDSYFPIYRSRSDFIRQHVFPGGMLLSPQKIQESAENAGLKVDGLFRFGKDYAKTLRLWLDKFEASLSEIHDLGYDDRFVRVWRYYLAICAATFSSGRTDVMQIELSHA
ncbi:MAG: cyclopropane-fatty-acyl-phospholipid synthase family protein [Rhodospirillales bacterium]